MAMRQYNVYASFIGISSGFKVIMTVCVTLSENSFGEFE